MPDSILVAEGTYYPDRSEDRQIRPDPNNRNNSFSLLPKVKMLGGYAAGGGSRDTKNNPTILLQSKIFKATGMVINIAAP